MLLQAAADSTTRPTARRGRGRDIFAPRLWARRIGALMKVKPGPFAAPLEGLPSPAGVEAQLAVAQPHHLRDAAQAGRDAPGGDLDRTRRPAVLVGFVADPEVEIEAALEGPGEHMLGQHVA